MNFAYRIHACPVCKLQIPITASALCSALAPDPYVEPT